MAYLNEFGDDIAAVFSTEDIRAAVSAEVQPLSRWGRDMPEYFSGLDLGQAQDYSALVVLEHSHIPDPERSGRSLNRFDVRHLHRWQLGTSYPAVVADLTAWYQLLPLHQTTLVVDATGVGRAVVDMIRQSQLPAEVRAYTITAGREEGNDTVPKKDLVGAVLAALQTRRLRFAETLPLCPTLERELEMYRVKVTADRNETFSAFRDKDHDDLVLALALALWYGERNAPAPPTPRTPRPQLNPFSRLHPDTFR